MKTDLGFRKKTETKPEEKPEEKREEPERFSRRKTEPRKRRGGAATSGGGAPGGGLGRRRRLKAAAAWGLGWWRKRGGVSIYTRRGAGGLESRWDSASREGLGAVAAGWALARLAWRAGAALFF